MYMYVDFHNMKLRFYRYMCMYMYVDFDIIKCRLYIYMFVYMYVDFDIIIFVSTYICYSTNWNPVGSRILLVQIGIPIYTSRNWNSNLYWI